MKRLINKKRISKMIIFCAVLIFILNVLTALLRPKTSHGIKQSLYMYSQPHNTIDVAFMGSSHVHCDINTKQIWEDYGIAGYNYSAAEQPLWITYYYLKELCKNQNPKLVVLDLYSPARYTEDYQYKWLADNLNGVRFSINKIKMVNSACESDRIFSYFPSFFNFHSRYDEIGVTDIKELFVSNNAKKAFKGYTPYTNIAEVDEPNVDYTVVGELTPKSEEYLYKIIDYTKENDIDLYFIVAPYCVTTEDEAVYNKIKEIAADNDIKYTDDYYFIKAAGIDYSTDLNDLSHLNFNGSCKFSKVLADEIKKDFEIPDRRGNKKWESWDRQQY